MALIRVQNPLDLPTVVQALRGVVEEINKHANIKVILDEDAAGYVTLCLVGDDESGDVREAAWSEVTSLTKLEELDANDEAYAFEQACVITTVSLKEMVKALNIPVGVMSGEYTGVSTMWIFPDGSTKTANDTVWWKNPEDEEEDDNFEEKKPGFFGAWGRAVVEDDEPDQESSFDTET